MKKLTESFLIGKLELLKNMGAYNTPKEFYEDYIRHIDSLRAFYEIDKELINNTYNKFLTY